jgi:hypothetical protein
VPKTCGFRTAERIEIRVHGINDSHKPISLAFSAQRLLPQACFKNAALGHSGNFLRIGSGGLRPCLVA